MAALSAIDLGTGRTATAISAGSLHTCALAALPPVLLSPVATLNLRQSADEASVSAAGGVIHYHVTLSNTGNVPLTGIAVTDPNAPACAGPVANLAPGGSTTIDCNHTATASDVGTYSNTATADTAETNPVGSNQVDVTVTIPTGSGRIAGVVTLSGSGSPVGGALVAALSPVDLSPVGIGIAKPDGRYAFLAPPGTYRLYTVDFTLAGTITDTNGAVANVVAMSIDLTAGGPGPGDLTDGSGRYSIGGLSAGPHLAQFVDPSGGHDREFHDDAATPAGSTILGLSSGATTTADATLATRSAPGQGSLIYGAVSSSGGGALSDVAVFAVNAADLSLARGAVTAGGGFYLIPLPAGSYKFAFYDPAGAHRFEWHADQPAEFFDDTTDQGAATNLATPAAAVLTGINATLTPTP